MQSKTKEEKKQIQDREFLRKMKTFSYILLQLMTNYFTGDIQL